MQSSSRAHLAASLFPTATQGAAVGGFVALRIRPAPCGYFVGLTAGCRREAMAFPAPENLTFDRPVPKGRHAERVSPFWDSGGHRPPLLFDSKILGYSAEMDSSCAIPGRRPGIYGRLAPSAGRLGFFLRCLQLYVSASQCGADVRSL